MTHWKKLFTYDYLSAEEFDGKDVTLTIKKIEIKEMFNGKTKEENPVLYFEQTDKGIVLNRVNAKSIARLLGTPDTDKWIGNAVTFFPQDITAFGQAMIAIRVRNNRKSLNA